MITIKLPYTKEHHDTILYQYLKLYQIVWKYNQKKECFHLMTLSSMPYIQDFYGAYDTCFLHMLNALDRHGHVTYIDPDGTQSEDYDKTTFVSKIFGDTNKEDQS